MTMIDSRSEYIGLQTWQHWTSDITTTGFSHDNNKLQTWQQFTPDKSKLNFIH